MTLRRQALPRGENDPPPAHHLLWDPGGGSTFECPLPPTEIKQRAFYLKVVRERKLVKECLLKLCISLLLYQAFSPLSPLCFSLSPRGFI